MKMDIWQLKQRQSLPMEAKVELSKSRIRAWYEHFDGEVYVAFSGGLDSTVLLDLVRSIYPNVPAAFIDTGLEFPEIREFVRGYKNVEWLRPAMPFSKVLSTYGYPIISKEQSLFIYQYRHTKSDKLRKLRWEGRDDKRKNGKIAEKYKYMVDAPFEISDRCCDVLKKRPAHEYARRTGRRGIVGIMAEDSSLRQSNYLKYGCNSFDAREPLSRPMSFWLKSDVWEYIRAHNLPYCDIYDKGYDRTGCIFCMFGVQHEKGENRFQRLAVTHPQLHAYCMDKLGLRSVLEFIGVPTGIREQN